MTFNSTSFTYFRPLFPALLCAGLISLSSCNGSNRTDRDVSTSSVPADTIPAANIFHADNDIAMVVGSLADALAVGEHFDPEIYNFSGVLTDGNGAPLYVDTRQIPGRWTVEVKSPSLAVISNDTEGDLVAADIVDYLTACLRLSAAPAESSDHPDKGVTLTFNLPRGYIIFHAPRPDTMQGCNISVSLTDSIP